jgi:hypothetical protein
MKNKDEKVDLSKVEGEGSYSAARRYREGLARSEQEGRADELAQEAKKAVDGPEGPALREAEERAKRMGNGAGAKKPGKAQPAARNPR